MSPRSAPTAPVDEGTSPSASPVLDPLVPRLLDLPTDVPLDPRADLSPLDTAKIFAAPTDPARWPAWRAQLRRWRDEARDRDGHDTRQYADPEHRWASRCWVVGLIWLWDDLLWDPVAGRFTPERLVADHVRFGGLDAVVLWHAYPVIGLDDRNQFDWYRDVRGLAAVVKSLHELGTRVFLDYLPWDVGTRPAAVGRPGGRQDPDGGETRDRHDPDGGDSRDGGDADRIAELVAELGADGVFLDTLREAGPELVARLQKLRPGPVLEGETKVSLARTADHLLSWAQWFADSEVPGVLRARWFEQRHMVHHTRRWNRDHSAELRSAWVNGAGILVWEAVFGSWVGWNARDVATLRGMRRVHRVLGDTLVDGRWTPLCELPRAATAAGVSASRFDRAGQTLWTLVNSSSQTYAGPVLEPGQAGSGGRWFDVVSGLPVVVRPGPAGTAAAGSTVGSLAVDSGGVARVVVESAVPAGGVGGLLHLADGVPEPVGLRELLRDAAADPGSTDTSFPGRSARRRPAMASTASDAVAPGHVVVAAGTYSLRVVHRVRETGLYGEAPFVEEWKPSPPRLHAIRECARLATVGRLAVAVQEVTNAEFAAFVDATGYAPRDPHRFLAHWQGGRPPKHAGGSAVTFVDLDDARAFARWRRARLPTEDEWQLAAGAPGWSLSLPPVWNWTESEHDDGRTRFAILKGGSWFRAEGSDWYLDGGPQPPEVSVKILLAGAGLMRSAAVGFRCAVDLAAARVDSPDERVRR